MFSRTAFSSARRILFRGEHAAGAYGKDLVNDRTNAISVSWILISSGCNWVGYGALPFSVKSRFFLNAGVWGLAAVFFYLPVYGYTVLILAVEQKVGPARAAKKAQAESE
ncbi:hypothetical protein HDV04_004454 [Boothiomyces sp. JEL0838]|nr:hypothetical protein HDV04_004454 [Boothiomyces sp. JEL0838]